MNSASVALITNGSATGTGYWPGGEGVLMVAGTFGGTSATLEALAPDNATWLPIKAMDPSGVQTTVALTATGMFGFRLPPCQIRCVLTGGAPSGIYANASRVLE